MTTIIHYDYHHILIATIATILAAAATMIGGLFVLKAKSTTNPRLLAFGLSFAGGAMVYISLVEIFVKSNMAFATLFAPKDAYIYTTIAFFVGVGLLCLIDHVIPNPHSELEPAHTATNTPSHNNGNALPHSTNIDHKHVGRVGLMAALAITIHNFPEGMATFFSMLDNPALGAPMAMAIAVHNIPEGISIAIPVFYATGSKPKALLACFISAIAEPIGALIGYSLLSSVLTPFVYGSVFGVIAGAMVFLSLDELLPSAKRYSTGHDTVYGMILGMFMVALSLILFK